MKFYTEDGKLTQIGWIALASLLLAGAAFIMAIGSPF